jgi:hypothetical protein
MKTRLTLAIFALSIFTFVILGSATNTNQQTPIKIAYAHVLSDGTLDAAHSRNVVAIGGANGLYCFKLGFIPNAGTATLADDPSSPSQGVGFIKVSMPPTDLYTCTNIPDPDATVETGNLEGANGGVSSGGYAFYAQWTK